MVQTRKPYQVDDTIVKDFRLKLELFLETELSACANSLTIF